MLKTKLLILLSVLIVTEGCSLFSGKKKKQEKLDTEIVDLAEETIETANVSPEPLNDETQDADITSGAQEFVDVNEEIIDIEAYIEDTELYTASDMTDRMDTYSSVVADFQDDITRLRSELEVVTSELYELKAKSQIWENPFSIYNKEIILNNGSTVYGKITYQDQEIIYVETLIGGLTVQRKNVKRVIENITQLPDSTEADYEKTRRNEILEIKQDEETTIFEPSTKLLANAILVGDIYEEVDLRGNRILSGDVKNIGEARADFVKINFVFRMNWQGKTKSLTAFVRGAKHVFPDSNIESDSSIEIGAVAGFELVIPPDFGTFIGYSYSLDWEQYDE